jgi:hypothetical protein
VFRPSEKEFRDPMKYIERIRLEAQQFGMCKVIGTFYGLFEKSILRNATLYCPIFWY